MADHSSDKTIISVTSYPPRIASVARSLETLATQSDKVDGIHLWLAKDDFDETGADGFGRELGGILNEIESLGVGIRWCERTLGPHDKYLWEMRESPDRTIITFDDDLLYPSDVVSNLLAAHEESPDSVIATRTHMVAVAGCDTASHIAPYTDWMLEQRIYERAPRFDLLATGVGGILYPPRCFDERIFDTDAIEKTTPLADDLWLYANELLCDVPVVSVCNFSLEGRYVEGTQEVGLARVNRHSGGNDAALDRLFEVFPEVRRRMIAEASGNEASSALACVR